MATVTRLENGITLICDERPGAGKVSFQLTIRGGSGAEPAEEQGLTSLMQEVSMGGTKTRTRQQIAEAVESKGAAVYTTINQNRAMYFANTPARHAAEVFGVMADVVCNPVFDAAEIKKTRKQVADYLKKAKEKAANVASSAFLESAFADQGVGRVPLGNEALLNSFSQSQLITKHQEILSQTEGMILSVSGDITAAAALELAQKHFSDLPRGAAAPAVAATFTTDEIRTPNKNSQMNIVFGFPAPAKQDPDFYAALMLRELLSGGMSSPLFQEIREKRGLVYSVNASLGQMADTGIFNITAGTGKGKVGELIDTSITLLGDIARNGFSDEDIEIARARLQRARLETTETTGSAAAFYTAEVLDFGHIRSSAEYAAELAAVTNDDVRRVCASMLSSGKIALAAIGPQDTMPLKADIEQKMQQQAEGLYFARNAKKKVAAPFFNDSAAAEQSFDPPQITILPNGIQVVTVERPGNLSCGAWVGVGANNEPATINGASHMMEHMMFKGTPSYGAGTIDRLVERDLKGGLNAYTSEDRTCYYFYKLDPVDLGRVTHLCGEMVFMANIDHEEFDGKTVTQDDGSSVKLPGERDVVLEEIKRANDNPDRVLWYDLMARVYPGQPHGRTVLGPSSIISHLTVEEMRAYRDTYYVPNNTVFCAVGPVKHADFVNHVSQNFGQLPARNFPDMPMAVYHGGVGYTENEDTEVCTLYLVNEGLPIGHKDEPALVALSTILSGGDSCKLYNKLVNEEELCGAFSTGAMSARAGGMFLSYFMAEPQNMQKLIAAYYEEIRDMTANVSETALAKAKIQMEVDLLKSLECNDDACDAYAQTVQNYGRLMTTRDFLKQIESITVDDIKKAAQTVLRSKPTAVALTPVGSAKVLPDQEALIALRDGRTPRLPTQTPTLDII